jgi:hypothetical protein
MEFQAAEKLQVGCRGLEIELLFSTGVGAADHSREGNPNHRTRSPACG